MAATGFFEQDELLELGFASIGNDVKIDRTAIFYGSSRIQLGSHVRIDAYSVISAGQGGISIGSYIHLAAYTFMAGAARIEMHDFSGLSSRCSIYSSSDDYMGNALTNPTVPDEYRNVQNGPVILKKHVIIGAGSVILPGVSMEEGSAAGALSVISKDVPAYTIVAGQPAKPIAERKKNLLKIEAEFLNSKA